MENLVFVSGRLTADSDIKYYESGKCKATFTLAVDGYFNKEKITSFIKCEAWGKQAEFAAEYFKKGKNVSVFGELKKNKFTDKNTNKEVEYYFVQCKTINFASSLILDMGIVEEYGNNKIKISFMDYGVECDCFINDEKLKEVVKETGNSVVMNFAIKDKKPIYSVVSML